MLYVKVQWESLENNIPCEIYSEIGDDNFEQRKIEIYEDGRVAYAYYDTFLNLDVEVGTFLSYEQYPSLDSINDSKDNRETIIGTYITQEEFEKSWFRYVTGKMNS